MLIQFGEQVKRDLQTNILGRTTPLPETGPYPEWEPLKESTIQAKSGGDRGKGGDPESILWDSGNLASSIEYTVTVPGHEVKVGTDVEYAATHEYGSSHVPPRPFLGPAAIRAWVLLGPRFERTMGRYLGG